MHIGLGEQGWRFSGFQQEKTGAPVWTVGMAPGCLVEAESSPDCTERLPGSQACPVSSARWDGLMQLRSFGPR